MDIYTPRGTVPYQRGRGIGAMIAMGIALIPLIARIGGRIATHTAAKAAVKALAPTLAGAAASAVMKEVSNKKQKGKGIKQLAILGLSVAGDALEQNLRRRKRAGGIKVGKKRKAKRRSTTARLAKRVLNDIL